MYLFLKPHKGRIKRETVPIVFREKKQQSLPVPLQTNTHSCMGLFPQYPCSLYHTHSNTTSIRCGCFILVCCSAFLCFPQCKLVVGKKQEGGKCDSHISANCFPGEHAMATLLGSLKTILGSAGDKGQETL